MSLEFKHLYTFIYRKIFTFDRLVDTEINSGILVILVRRWTLYLSLMTVLNNMFERKYNWSFSKRGDLVFTAF